MIGDRLPRSSPHVSRTRGGVGFSRPRKYGNLADVYRGVDHVADPSFRSRGVHRSHRNGKAAMVASDTFDSATFFENAIGGKNEGGQELVGLILGYLAGLPTLGLQEHDRRSAQSESGRVSENPCVGNDRMDRRGLTLGASDGRPSYNIFLLGAGSSLRSACCVSSLPNTPPRCVVNDGRAFAC